MPTPNRTDVCLRPYEWEVVVAVLLWADKNLREQDPEWSQIVDPHGTLRRLATWIEDQHAAQD